MKRRDFSAAAALGAGAALGLAPGAQAQGGGPIEGRHYLRLAQPVPPGVGPGKVEVIEFFWYGCPHCFAFEPMLASWVQQLPPHVAFVRVPVAFTAVPFTAHQRIYYALESMGLVAQMHLKVFSAIHNERLRLAQPDEISAFVTRNGIDAAAFMQAFQSFSTQTRVTQANRLVAAYPLDGVPSLGIHGRFFTSGTLAGSSERMLAAADWLIQGLPKPA